MAAQALNALDLVRLITRGAAMRPGTAVPQPSDAFELVRRFQCAAVRVLTPAATAAFLMPWLAMLLTKCSRPRGVNEAFLWLFIRVCLRLMVWLENLHLR